MGKGIGMPTALIASSDAEVRADAVDKRAGPFKCIGCGVAVRHVKGYPIHLEDPELTTLVKPFFRLPRGNEFRHALACRNTPVGQVSLLVARAEAVEDSLNPFVPAADGTIIFRMNILRDEINRETAAEPRQGKTNFPQRLDRVWSSRRLASFCRSAVGIARIWQELEAKSAKRDLQKRVLIEVNGKRVLWKDFFYPPDRFSELSALLEEGTSKHPIAVLLHVKQIDLAGPTGSVRFTPVADPNASEPTWFSFKAYGRPDAMQQFVEGESFIVFGDFRFRDSNLWRGLRTYRNIVTNVYQAAQYEQIHISHIELDD